MDQFIKEILKLDYDVFEISRKTKNSVWSGIVTFIRVNRNRNVE